MYYANVYSYRVYKVYNINYPVISLYFYAIVEHVFLAHVGFFNIANNGLDRKV